MSSPNLFRETGIENKIYNSVYAETVWSWLENGMPVASIVASLKALSAKEGDEFSITEPTVRSFKRIMEDIELKQVGKSLGVGDNSRAQFQNDLVLCELGIANGLRQLQEGKMLLTMQSVLALLEFKRKIMGDKYKGQSITDLLDVTKQFYELIDAVSVHCDKDTFNAIMEDLKSKGWSDDETGDELRVKRKTAASSIEFDLSNIE